MRRHIITLVVLALITGGLYQAAERTGSGLLTMASTIGLFLIGGFGVLALNQWQLDSGVREVEQALKSLEPDCLITDWSGNPGSRPDYLVVGPGGVAAICVDPVPHTASATKATVRIALARQRTDTAAKWVSTQLGETFPGTLVKAILVLSRRRADEAYSTSEVLVVNSEHLGDIIRAMDQTNSQSQPKRIQITRLVRQS